MSLEAFLREVDDQVKIVNGSDFKIEVVETETVPHFDDGDLTYDNMDSKVKRCKRLESCVLYIDIRNSAQISSERQPETLARLYSSFISVMLRAAQYYGGHVRNIIGDRVMVVFDREKCFGKAVDTAILMNTISAHIINKHVKTIDFKCGIGIDYGKMLVTKAGRVRRGEQKEFYRSLVWLGRPANIASKLTDVANKASSRTDPIIREHYYYPNIYEDGSLDRTYAEFLDDLESTGSPELRHKNPYFTRFARTYRGPYITTPAPILMTEAVYDGLKQAQPQRKCITEGWLTVQTVSVPGHTGKIYGGNIRFTEVDKL